MAEVSGKLHSGVYRLSALRSKRGRAVRAGRPPGSQLVAGTCGVKGDSAQGQCEAEPESRRRAARRKSAKVYTVKTRQGKLENEASELLSSRFDGFLETTQSHQTAPYFPDRLQPVLQEELPSRRMAFWTGEALSFNPHASPQQQRAFCTVVLLLAGQGSEMLRCGKNVNCLRLHCNSSTTGRNYSRSTDAPLLYRSRTTYYDILKVSPGATQSQIKTAYYKQSFIYHPDKNPGSKEAVKCFSEISEAYSVLGNIGLRRKYDRGILSRSDIQSAGRPPSKEATSRPTGPSWQHQQRPRHSSRPGGKTMYDFDAFYQAHYGEQVQKERDMRARKEQMREMEKQKLQRREWKMIEMSVVVLLATAGLIFINIARS